MPRFETALDIAASREAVWGLLAQGERYPQWHPAVHQVEGTVAVGESIVIIGSEDPTRGQRFSVISLEPESSMVWRSGLPFGVFGETRTFLLGDSEAGVRFELSADYTGPLSPVLGRMMPNLQASLDQFADALRMAAERRTAN